MRFEILDTKLVKKHFDPIEVPRGRNRVQIGTGPDCDVRLTSSLPELVAGLRLESDGRWWFYNLAPGDGLEIEVGPVALAPGEPTLEKYVLWESSTKVLVADRQLSVKLDRYQIRVVFEADEFAPQGADLGRLDEQMVKVIRRVHAQLLNELVTTHADDREKYQPEYIMRLEKLVDQVAGRSPDFPADDLTRTALGDHMAGVAVKSELIRRLIADSGRQIARTRGSDAGDADWLRLRTKMDEGEAELLRLVGRARQAIDDHLAGSTDAGDLTARMSAMAERFWPFWEELLAGPAKPGLGSRRYLALRRLKEEIKDYWYGFGPLEDLLDDPTVSEIMVLDADHVFVETGGQIEDSGRRFLTDPKLVIKNIVHGGEREFNDSQPLVNVRMPDGSRVNAVHECLALRGACLTVRRFPKVRLTMEELIARGSITAAAAAFLKAAVTNRRNILVSGGTGTGKTTLLNCLSMFIPDKERIVTIEDTAELQLQKTHVVTLQARPANLQGEGEISIRDLVKNALRMRPDRIVVGECRGAEALDMLQAMNTGHDGSLTTLHANNPADVVQRLETMCQMPPNKEMPVESIHRMVTSAVDLVVQLQAGYETLTRPDGTVGRKRTRTVSDISELVGLDPAGGIVIKSLFARPPEGGPLRPTGCLPTFLIDLIAAGLAPDPLAFVRDAAPEFTGVSA